MKILKEYSLFFFPAMQFPNNAIQIFWRTGLEILSTQNETFQI